MHIISFVILYPNVMAADGNYVGQISANVTFRPGSSAGDQVCSNTLIYSDGVLESSEATINVEVLPRGFDLVTVEQRSRSVRVTIVDANGKQSMVQWRSQDTADARAWAHYV